MPVRCRSRASRSSRKALQSSLIARMHLTLGVVVGVKQVLEMRVEDLVAVCPRRENELFEKPSGMRQVPLGRADARHGLNYVVLRLQGAAKRQAGRPDRLVAIVQTGRGADGGQVFRAQCHSEKGGIDCKVCLWPAGQGPVFRRG